MKTKPRYMVGGVCGILLFIGYSQWEVSCEQEKAIHELEKAQVVNEQNQKSIEEIKEKQERDIEKFDQKLDKIIIGQEQDVEKLDLKFDRMIDKQERDINKLDLKLDRIIDHLIKGKPDENSGT